MEKIDDPLQNDFGTLSQKTGLKGISGCEWIMNNQFSHIFGHIGQKRCDIKEKILGGLSEYLQFIFTPIIPHPLND